MQAAQSGTKAPRVTLQCVLAEMAGAGDRWAQGELVRIYDQMIRSTSLSMMRGTVSQTFEDIQQLAAMALLGLAKSFRVGGGAVFTTYLYSFLARAIRRELDGIDSLVRIPKVHKLEDRKQGRSTGVYKFPLAQTASIDGATSREGEEIFGSDDLLAHLSPDSVNVDNVEDMIDAGKVKKALDSLQPLDRQVVTLRLTKEMAFNEIGPIVGRSHQGAVNAYLRGMSRIRMICGAPQIENEDIGVCAKKRGPKRKEVTQ